MGEGGRGQWTDTSPGPSRTSQEGGRSGVQQEPRTRTSSAVSPTWNTRDNHKGRRGVRYTLFFYVDLISTCPGNKTGRSPGRLLLLNTVATVPRVEERTCERGGVVFTHPMSAPLVVTDFFWWSQDSTSKNIPHPLRRRKGFWTDYQPHPGEPKGIRCSDYYFFP